MEQMFIVTKVEKDFNFVCHVGWAVIIPISDYARKAILQLEIAEALPSNYIDCSMSGTLSATIIY